ncbi:MAG TPA: hypothetical protein VF543_19130 [Pyrinomonadaceae bacterium]
MARTTLLLIGWLMFLLSCFLPVSLTIGVDAGLEPHRGFSHIFFSFISIYLIFASLDWSDKAEVVFFLGIGIIGLFNLLMLIAPTLLLLRGKKSSWVRWIIAFAALFVCTVGFLIFQNLQLLYGYYVWCLSFVIVAVALNRKESQMALI